MSETDPNVNTTRGLDPRWLPLGVTVLGMFMTILDNNIINIALPSILKSFDASLGQGQLVVTAYVMALVVVIPMSGFLGERIGMKRLYICVMAAFITGSTLCGLAWNIESLVAFRIFQGIGGGMLQPLGMALIFSIITPIERPRFVAVLGLPVLIGPLVGPTIGGYLVEYVGWRSVFLMNVPVGLLCIVLASKYLTETPIKRETRLDAQGLAFATLAFPSLLFAASRGTEIGWLTPPIIAILTVGFVALVLFIRQELRYHDPMLRLSLFRHPMFRLASFVQWIGIFSLFGLNVIIPLYLQNVDGMTPSEAGKVLIPMGVVAFVTMNVAGRFYTKLGPRPIIMAGLFVMTLTTLAWSFVSHETSTLWLVILVSARGLGLGMFGQFVQIVAYNTVAQDEMPRATALVTTGQRLTTAFSTAMLTSALVVGLSWTAAPAGTSIAAADAPVEDMEQAFRYVFWLMTGLNVLGMVLASRLHDYALEETWQRPQARGHGAPVAAEPSEGG